jgi:hypothetical protein
MLVAALVVSMTPRRASNPLAISGTTAPGISQSVRAAGNIAGNELANAATSFRSPRIVSFNAIPNAIAAVPNAATPIGFATETASAILPELSDDVLVLTGHSAYAVPWSEVALLALDDDAIVVAADGSIIAKVIDGRLVVTADAKVGSAIALGND